MYGVAWHPAIARLDPGNEEGGEDASEEEIESSWEGGAMGVLHAVRQATTPIHLHHQSTFHSFTCCHYSNCTQVCKVESCGRDMCLRVQGDDDECAGHAGATDENC
jgi:hypothetical protein